MEMPLTRSVIVSGLLGGAEVTLRMELSCKTGVGPSSSAMTNWALTAERLPPKTARSRLHLQSGEYDDV